MGVLVVVVRASINDMLALRGHPTALKAVRDLEGLAREGLIDGDDFRAQVRQLVKVHAAPAAAAYAAKPKAAAAAAPAKAPAPAPAPAPAQAAAAGSRTTTTTPTTSGNDDKHRKKTTSASKRQWKE